VGATVATVVAENNGCARGGEASVWITLDHQPEVALTDHLADLAVAPEGTSLIDHIEQALGHRLRLR
jgi:hypothetical protein